MLVIEDDPTIIAALRRGLRTSYIIDIATTGMDGVHEAEVGDYDVVILDLCLPDMPGLQVCRSICAKAEAPPILVLTAEEGVDTKVALLDSGADDYLTKPFRLEELKARLRALARRKPALSRSCVLMAGDLRLDTAARRVERGGQSINLRRKEFDLLEYLLHNQGRVITRAMIIDHVWDASDTLWTNAVDVHIKYLRDKIDRPFAYGLIQTIHGVGYKLEAPQPAPANPGEAVVQ